MGSLAFLKYASVVTLAGAVILLSFLDLPGKFDSTLLAESYKGAISCDNKVDLTAWGRISHPDIVRYHADRLFRKVIEVKDKYGECDSSKRRKLCTRDLMAYLVEAFPGMRSLLEAECIKPTVTEEALSAAEAVKQAAAVKPSMLNFSFNKIKRNSLYLVSMAQSTLGKFLTSKTSNGKLYINYFRYDKDYDKWGLHLFRSPYGDVTVWDTPLHYEDKTDYGVRYAVNLSDFKTSDDINFIIHRGNEDKDFYGLDMSFKKGKKNNVWLVQNYPMVFESQEEAEQFKIKHNIPDTLYVRYERIDNDYEGWGLILVKFNLQTGGHSRVNEGMPLGPKEYSKGLYYQVPRILIGYSEKLKVFLQRANMREPQSEVFFNPLETSQLLIKGDGSVIADPPDKVQFLESISHK